MISYAQNFEDVMLWRCFKSVKNGFYIDVGANDPVTDSVTKWFYDNGWHGLNMEPTKEYFDLLCKDRTKDINLQCGAGDKTGEENFYYIPHTGLSTSYEKFADVHKKTRNLEVHETKINIVELKDVCDEYVKDQPIHFLKIDVEGAELAVVRGMNFHKYRPYVMVIEATIPNSTEMNDDFRDYVTSQGYGLVYFDGLSQFYVADEKTDELKKFFTVPPNIFDGFKRYDHYTAETNLWDVKAKATELKKALSETQAMVVELKRVLNETQRKESDLEKKLDETERQDEDKIVQLNTTICNLKKEIEMMKESKSWKVTEPLRALTRMLRG